MDRPDVGVLASHRTAAQVTDVAALIERLIVFDVRFPAHPDQSAGCVINGDRRVGAIQPVGVVEVKDHGDRTGRIVDPGDFLDPGMPDFEAVPIDVQGVSEVAGHADRGHVRFEQVDQLLGTVERITRPGQFARFADQR